MQGFGLYETGKSVLRGDVIGFWTRLGLGGGLFALTALILAVSPWGAPAIEQRLEAAARTELVARNYLWASVRASGRRLQLYLSTSAARDSADATSALENLPGVTAVIPVPVRAPQPAEKPRATAPAQQIVVEQPFAETADKPPATAAETLETCRKAINRTLNGRRLTFRHESSSLTDEDLALLSALSSSLTNCEGETILIEGHTDSTGSHDANMRLSLRRAETVAEVLRRAASSTRFDVAAFGETRPIASNQSATGREANRRIDFSVVASKPESE